MKNNFLFYFLLPISLFILIACDKDDEDMDDMTNLELNINGLENLGGNFAYEGWIVVDGNPKTTGTFTVDDKGQMSQTEFSLDAEDLQNASTFVLTIEPSPDNDPAPTDVHIIAGDFNSETASLTIDHGAALNTNFSDMAGDYVLATPTNGMMSDEHSGIWFLDNSSGSPMASLELSPLPKGWIYEGWAVINGVPVSTGTFSAADMADNAAPYSGNMAGPPFPGEDFLMNAPNGLSFPTNLSGGMAVISVEPVPDNSSGPFLLKPMASAIPQNAADHTIYPLAQNLVFPTGTATR